MAVKFNTEFNYRYLIQGETTWERIKHVKSFLEGRIRAGKGEESAKLKYQAKQSEITHLYSINALPHVIMVAQAEMLDIEAAQQIQADAFELNRQEIEILQRYLAELYEIAEPTRVPGYTDEQMFELNAANEFTTMIVRELQSEIIANGRPSPAKLHNAMSNPYTFAAAQKLGLIPEDVKRLVPSVDPKQIVFTLEAPDALQIK